MCFSPLILRVLALFNPNLRMLAHTGALFFFIKAQSLIFLPASFLAAIETPLRFSDNTAHRRTINGFNKY